MSGRLRAALAAIAWLVAVGAIALGAAGLVAATDPGTGGPEQARLEYGGDAEVAAALDRAEADLGTLSNTVDDLGTQARGALAAVIARDPKTMDDALAAGDKLLVDIVRQSGAIQTELAAVPYVRSPEAPLHVSPAVRQRYQRLVDALAATTGLESSWTRLTVDSAAASRLASQLADHDAARGQGRVAGPRREVRQGHRDAEGRQRHARGDEALSRPAAEHRGRIDARPVDRAEHRLRQGPVRAVRRPRQGGRQGHEQGAQGHRDREGRAGPSSRPTPGAS